MSKQLPCRSAEVKFFSAKGVVKFGVKFSVLRFPGFGCARENFHQNFTSKTASKTEHFTQTSLCWGAALMYVSRCGCSERRGQEEKPPSQEDGRHTPLSTSRGARALKDPKHLLSVTFYAEQWTTIPPQCLTAQFRALCFRVLARQGRSSGAASGSPPPAVSLCFVSAPGDSGRSQQHGLPSLSVARTHGPWPCRSSIQTCEETISWQQ